MKKNTLFSWYFTVIIFLLFLSCKDKIKENNQPLGEVTIIHLDSLMEANLLLSNHCFDSLRNFSFDGCLLTLADGWPDSLRTIKLETSSECLLGALKKIEFADSLIFISDYNEHLYVFDMNGRFLNRIGEIGRDPNQVSAITSFYVDKNNKVVGVYDGFRRCIHRYSYLGIKYDKITCGEQIESGSITDVNVIANRELLLTLSCGIDDLYNYAILSADDGSLKAYILPYQVKYTENSTRGNLSCFARPSEKLWLTALLSDTIYEYADGKIIPKFVVKSSLATIDAEVFVDRKEWISPAHAMAFLRDNGYSKGQTGIWANDRYLYFDMFCRGSWYSIYYDYLNHKGYKSKQYSRGNVLMPGRFLTTTSDAFVSYVTAYDFIHQPEGCIDVDRPLWRDLRERTMEDDNPILLLYYIRK